MGKGPGQGPHRNETGSRGTKHVKDHEIHGPLVESEVMKAIWNEKIVAESEDTLALEGNHYFPESALKREYFRPSAEKTSCFWKGDASYFDVVVDDQVARGAAWYYPDPSPKAQRIKGRVAFWRGVRVEK